MIELGDEVKDLVSGFKGVAVAKHSYLQGCDRISVQPPVDKEGMLLDSQSFDEPQLIVVKKGKVTAAKKSANKPPGGPEKYRDTKRVEGFRK